MLFSKVLRRDLSNAAGVVFASLFTIMVTTTLIRLLGRAAGGGVDTASVVPLIAFSAFNFLSVLLVLTLFMSVLMVLSRAYRDSEMVIWFSSGLSLMSWIRPLFRFAAPFLALITLTAFFIAPWANRQAAEYRQRFEQRDDLSQIAAGQFRESVRASRVFFVESLAQDGQSVSNIFVAQRAAKSETVVVASAGRIETQGKDRFLVLQQGRRYDSALPGGEASDASTRMLEFERYGIRIDPQSMQQADESSKTASTLTLIRNPTSRNLGELLWRCSLPLSACVLVLLAIPLSYVNARVGRSVNLILALLLYVVYNSLLSLSQASVNSGKLSFGLGIWAVHALFLAVAALLLWRRLRLGGRFGVSAWLRRLASAKVPPT
jgi:lipopolysaccharide export system permease protein